MSNDQPVVLYEPVLLDDEAEGIVYQAGAFRSEADAQAVLDIWRAEGRTEPMSINLVAVYESAADWQADR